MAERRAEGVRLLQGGEMSQVEIAHSLSVSEAAVSQWKRKLEQGGPDACNPALLRVGLQSWMMLLDKC